MTILGICFNGAAHGVAGHHDPLLVAVSFVVAAFASYTALELAERLRVSRGRARWLWQIAAAIALGGGVWSAHFIGILAFRIPLSHAYDPLLTILSGLLAIGAVACGLQVVQQKATWSRIGGAGLLVGIGIATMHYAGMAALRFPGQVYYRPGLFALSVVIAVGAATAALWLAYYLRFAWQRGLAAPVMALAVCGMHYTGMAATVIVARPASLHLDGAVHADFLARLVVAGVGLLAFLGLLGAFFDRIREQRRSQQELREAIDVMPAALGFYDAEDRLITWNAAYAGFFEDPSALRPGMLFANLLRGELSEEELAQVLESRHQLRTIERQFPDGRWMHIDSRRTADGGAVTVGTDISALKAQAAALEKARDAAEAASRAKSVFLNTMGHELRTPLNGVLGMVQALEGDGLSEMQRQRVEVIRQSSESLLAIIGDLLDLTQIEAGALTPDDDEFDLVELLAGVVGAHRLATEAKGLLFFFEISACAQARYRGDSARIRRIVFNLLNNAVKFTDRGDVRLTVDVLGDLVRFEVSDTGPGVSEVDAGRLFDPFFQVDAGLTRRHGGAGIGLAVSRQLAQLLGGHIVASSRIGEGSVFTVELPLARVVGATDATTRSDDLPGAPVESLHVLAAEDNPVNQMVLQTLLGAIGVEVVLVGDGEAALAAWTAQPWDIVLMDIQMPRMNGIEATLAIRAREAQEGRVRTPIIAVTANAMAHQIRDYLAAGMDDVIAKPVELAALLAAMDQALNSDAKTAEVA